MARERTITINLRLSRARPFALRAALSVLGFRIGALDINYSPRTEKPS